MMNVKFLSNKDGSMLNELKCLIQGASLVRVVMGFVRSSGIRLLGDGFERLCAGQQPGKLRVIVGSVPTQLSQEAFDVLGGHVKICPRETGGRLLHAKTWVIEKAGQRYVVVGSGNLTAGGLRWNFEQGVSFRVEPGSTESVRIDEFVNWFDGIWDRKDTAPDRSKLVSEAVYSDPDTPESVVMLAPAVRERGSSVELFDYQKEMVDAVLELVRRPNRSNDNTRRRTLQNPEEQGKILWLPTGAGKTRVALEVVFQMLADSRRVLWLCGRRIPLLQSALGSILSVPSLPGGRRPERIGLKVSGSAALIDSVGQEYGPELREEFKGRLSKGATDLMFATYCYARDVDVSQYSLIVVDEAHGCKKCGKNSGKVISRVVKASALPHVIGLSASPYFADRDYWSNFWSDALLVPAAIGAATLGRASSSQIAEMSSEFSSSLELDEVLARLKGKSVDTGFEYQFKGKAKGRELELERSLGSFDNEYVNGAVERALREDCGLDGTIRRILLFAVNIDHAKKLVDRIRGMQVDGLSAICVHSRMTRESIARGLGEFRAIDGGVRVLVSVNMLLEGVDLPLVDALFMVRPTMSPIVYTQMLGRGRRGPKVGGTKVCHVFDFVNQFFDEDGKELGVQVLLENYERKAAAMPDED